MHPPPPVLLASPPVPLAVKYARQELVAAEEVLVAPVTLQPVLVDEQVVLQAWLDALRLQRTLQSPTTLEESHEVLDETELEA